MFKFSTALIGFLLITTHSFSRCMNTTLGSSKTVKKQQLHKSLRSKIQKHAAQRKPKPLKEKQKRRLKRAITHETIAANPAALLASETFLHKTAEQQRRLRSTTAKLTPAINRDIKAIRSHRYAFAASCSVAILACLAYEVYMNKKAHRSQNQDIQPEPIVDGVQEPLLPQHQADISARAS